MKSTETKEIALEQFFTILEGDKAFQISGGTLGVAISTLTEESH